MLSLMRMVSPYDYCTNDNINYLDDNDPNVIKDTIMEKQSTLPGQPTQIVNTPKENTSPSVLSFNVTTSPQKPSGMNVV